MFLLVWNDALYPCCGADYTRSLLCSNGTNREASRASDTGSDSMRLSRDLGCKMSGTARCIRHADGGYVCTIALPLDCTIPHSIHSERIPDTSAMAGMSDALDFCSSPLVTNTAVTATRTAVRSVALPLSSSCRCWYDCMRFSAATEWCQFAAGSFEGGAVC
jgi:hypothetical protein